MNAPSPIPPSNLPIEDVIDDIREGLRDNNRLILAAPPGAGKTTRVPLSLMSESWAQSGRILVLEPRRIAARAAASRMAQTLAEPLGKTIGLRARMDVRTSANARIEVITEGVFTRMILDDPELKGVSAILFDEFHERSLDADFGLALALETQEALREDLRIMPMSATLDTERLQGFLAAPVIASDGRAHPVETRYISRGARTRIEDDTVRAIHQALREETGSILVFLPGAAEITRTAQRLEHLPPHTVITPLFGALSPQEQDAAIQPAKSGFRKIVLATDIAESSLTIEGVRIVIDAGLARTPRYDPQLNASRLETQRVSRASADQRRGRAGRTAPGVCYRLWHEAETRGLPAFPSPEILNADLSGLVLDMARWGAYDIEALNWLDAPPAGAWRASANALSDIGALDSRGRLTGLGKRIGELPLPPRLAAMVLNAANDDKASLAALIAALMTERGLGGRSIDIRERLNRFATEKSPRARAMQELASRWSKMAGGQTSRPNHQEAGDIIAEAFPDRIARARPGQPGAFLMANGRAALMDAQDPLASESWLAIADVTGGGPNLRIMLAAPLDESQALDISPPETIETATFDMRLNRLTARKIKRIGAITLSETSQPKPSGDAARQGLLDAFQAHGMRLLPCSDALETLCARIQFLNRVMGEEWPNGCAEKLKAHAEEWLAPMLEKAVNFDNIPAGKAVSSATSVLLDWSLCQRLDTLAPLTWLTPTDRNAAIDYTDEKGPLVRLKVQEAYGLTTHPHIADGRIPLNLELVSPAQRPVALTRDIAGFWTGGYADMRKDMRGRYPKHDWPEDPANASPQRGVKKRS